MSGLFSSLYVSANAMQTQSAVLDVVGRNMANVSNTAYSRQRVILGDKGSMKTPLGAQSLGIEAVGIQQMRDELLDGQVRDENSLTAASTTIDKYLQQAQAMLGEGTLTQSSTVSTISSNTANPTGLAGMVDNFFNAWQSYSTDPVNVINKQQLIAATDNLVSSLHYTDTQLADLSLPTTGNTVTKQMDADVTSANTLLHDIADLNKQIGSVEISNPGSAVDLRDQRESKLEDLSKIMDFTAVKQDNGEVGVQVVDASNAPVDLVNLATVGGTLARSGTAYQWVPTSGLVSTINVTGGSLSGYQQLGATIQGYRTQLDTFASSLVTRVNTAYNSTDNGDFFTAGGTTAATIGRTATVASLVAADATAGAGANTTAQAIAALANDTTFDNGTPAQAISGLVTAAGQDVSANTARLTDQKSISDLLATQRNAYGGVSLDEEATNMLQAQRAYQASAHMLSTINDMLSTMMDALAR